MRFVTIKENIMCEVLSLLALLCHTYTTGRMENLNWLSIPSIISLKCLGVTVYIYIWTAPLQILIEREPLKIARVFSVDVETFRAGCNIMSS